MAHPGMRSSAPATSGNVCSGWSASGRAPAARAGERTSSPDAPDRWATHCPERNPPDSAIRPAIASDVVVGDADEDELARPRRVRGIEERHAGEEPRRAVAGGTAARNRDDPVAGAAEEDRHRGPHASRADDRDVHRSEYAKSDRSTGQRIQTIGPSGAGASAGGCSRTRCPSIVANTPSAVSTKTVSSTENVPYGVPDTGPMYRGAVTPSPGAVSSR